MLWDRFPKTDAAPMGTNLEVLRATGGLACVEISAPNLWAKVFVVGFDEPTVSALADWIIAHSAEAEAKVIEGGLGHDGGV